MPHLRLFLVPVTSSSSLYSSQKTFRSYQFNLLEEGGTRFVEVELACSTIGQEVPCGENRRKSRPSYKMATKRDLLVVIEAEI